MPEKLNQSRKMVSVLYSHFIRHFLHLQAVIILDMVQMIHFYVFGISSFPLKYKEGNITLQKPDKISGINFARWGLTQMANMDLI